MMATDEAATHARLKALRRDFIEPAIAAHHGRIVKLMGDGALVEFASVVDAVQCAALIQRGVAERNAGVSDDQRIEFRIGVNLGDVIIEGDDIYGDGVNIAARLEGLAEPGGIVISGTAFDHAKNKAEAGFRFLGRQPVKNIPEPVRAYRVLLDPEAVGSVVDDEVPATRVRRRWPALAAAAAALLVLAGGGFWLWNAYWRLPRVEAASVERMAFPLPDKPSIAVLPFENVSAEPGQDYFADGITEDIITELSKVSGLFVIAYNSTAPYNDKPVEIRNVAEDLGVRYVLDGSVRRAGDQVRIATQLVDATTGHYLWAERYDRDLSEIFDIQDEVTRKVVAELAVTLKADENERLFRPHTQNFEAYDLFLRARKAWDPPTEENLLKGRELFEQVIELDAEFAGGYAGLSLMHSLFVQFGLSTAPEEDLATAYELAKKAAEVDDAFGWAHTALGTAHLMRREHDQAVTEARAAIRAQPGDADAHSYLGFYLHWAGRGEEAVESVRTAMRLNPQFMLRGSGRFRAFLGFAQFTAGHYADAAETLKELHEDMGARGGAGITTLAYLAASYSELGRDREARQAIEQLTDINPDASISTLSYLHMYKNQEDRERVQNAVRRAGLPE
jgi:TolB-like protein/Flp pilus assembly protein TadD